MKPGPDAGIRRVGQSCFIHDFRYLYCGVARGEGQCRGWDGLRGSPQCPHSNSLPQVLSAEEERGGEQADNFSYREDKEM